MIQITIEFLTTYWYAWVILFLSTSLLRVLLVLFFTIVRIWDIGDSDDSILAVMLKLLWWISVLLILAIIFFKVVLFVHSYL